MSPPASPLRANDAVLEAAARLAKAPSAEYRVVLRARIVDDAAHGFSNEENARRNGVRPQTVVKWRSRATLATHGETAFADAPRSGRPREIPVLVRATVIQIGCGRPTPELASERIEARQEEARSTMKAARKAARVAKSEARRAAQREAALRSAKPVDKARRSDAVKEARKAGRAAVRAEKRAKKDLAKGEAKLAAAQADAARAAMGHPSSFSAVWTQKEIQIELKRQTGETMSLSEIGRTLRCGGLRPHRVRIWVHSPDPDFHEKVRAICELYVTPPPGAVVLCFDEKPGMQAREDRHAIHVSELRETRREFEYVRNGTSTLLATFDVRTGEVFGRCWRRTAEGIDAFFEELAEKYPTGDVYIVCDNLNVHKGAAIDAFVARHGGRFHFVYTPLHASWMNQVEVWFGILQRRVLRHGSFSSVVDLQAAVQGFIRHWNEVECHPFRWRFRGDFVIPLRPAA